QVRVRRLRGLRGLVAAGDRGVAALAGRRHRRLLDRPGRHRDRPAPAAGSCRRAGAATHRPDTPRCRAERGLGPRRRTRAQRRGAAGLRAPSDRRGTLRRRHRAGPAQPGARPRGAHPAGRHRGDDRPRGRCERLALLPRPDQPAPAGGGRLRHRRLLPPCSRRQTGRRSAAADGVHRCVHPRPHRLRAGRGRSVRRSRTVSPSRSAGAAISPELAPAADAAPATTGPSSPGRDSAGPVGSGDRGGHGRPWLVILVATGIVLAIAVTIARGVYRDGPLEPDAPTPQGSKAVVEVLTDLGTQVRVDRHTEDAAQSLREDRTVLVTAPSSLSAPQLDELAGALEEGEGQLVLVQPDFVTLSYLTPLITPAGSLRAESTVEAGQSCGDLTFEARALAVPEALTNEGVRGADDDALGLDAGGPSGELSWYVPPATDPVAAAGPELPPHLPDWAGPVGLWILLVAGIALVAGGRRFGPVV